MDLKRIKNLLSKLDFTLTEGAKGIFRKEYSQFRNYAIEVNCDKQIIDYGNKIKCGSKRTLNFSRDENFVVLECVDRLLTKGYKAGRCISGKKLSCWTWGHKIFRYFSLRLSLVIKIPEFAKIGVG
jgi:type I restriction enzyme M protein